MIDRLRTHLLPACRRALQLALALPLLAAPLKAQWTAPTPEELSMTSQPQVPGAPAVYLFREEVSEDNLHMYSVYVRLKVLTEAGKNQANVELRYFAGSSVNNTVDSIAGRTIEPDGRVVPFTGKPYQKLIVRGQGMRYMAKVFTMPEVEVGSILEYRYKLRWDDHFYESPEWYVQSDYFVRKAHFQWKPTNTAHLVNDRGQLIGTIAWTNILPEGVKLQQTQLPAVGQHEGQAIFDLNVQDVAPQPEEDHMPPVSSFTYRVQFYYTAFRTGQEYWKSEGNFWAKKQDKLIGPGNAVRAAATELTAGADTPDAKLRKLYAAVQGFENTDFTRQHTTAEEKSEGFREVHTTEDVLARKRGDSDQLAELFIALARAAGFKAFPMIVTSRNKRIFYAAYLTFQQFDDIVAIVNVDGKDVFFDPGSRFCPYGHLAWKHTMAGGVREIDGGGSVLTNTPGESYTASRIQRVANLTMDEHGAVHGTAKLTFIGSPALRWRQHSLEGDDSSLNRELQEHMEHLLPHGMEVKVTSIEKLTDYEQPLTVNYDVSGLPGSPTGKRLVVPSDIFEANSRSTFPHEKRESAVYFEYPEIVQDALRINFPPTFSIESMPKTDGQTYAKEAAYKITTEQKPTSYTVRREFILGEIVFMPKDYPELRSFYNKVETRDQESLVLKVGEGGGSKSDTATSIHP